MDIIQALQDVLTKPSVLTLSVLDKAMWKQHKAVAFLSGIPTNVGQRFRTLIEKQPEIEAQRDAVEILLAVVNASPKATELKDALNHSAILPLKTLLDQLNTPIEFDTLQTSGQVEDII